MQLNRENNDDESMCSENIRAMELKLYVMMEVLENHCGRCVFSALKYCDEIFVSLHYEKNLRQQDTLKSATLSWSKKHTGWVH